ncbi:mitochondrial S-adenosylmethionine carrier protein isoform X12 [Erinaceus europaeus]|uniref:Mitochondrial S-adenosylmethionine carrier protein n=1 Tax=Erinaceus europaeus TaxID=9365 RepID=A0ABM3YCW8_ERIEU|nr:mitochondrial S-adenosylmethionine carrier protein isoform X12 [Erinaceus europaeus]
MDRLGATASLVAGGVAGVSVDLILFPLDTIKTRLQSPQGFKKAGGFRGIYAGVPSTAIGSFPNAAAFFITYESVKCFLHTDSSSNLKPVKHMLAASTGEVIPFSLVQFPLWESLKALWSWRQDHVLDSWQSAVCGAFADYLQVSFLEWQQSVWEVSSSSVLMTKLAACCWNLAQRVHELEMVPRPLLSRRGGCCENSYPSGEQLFDHLNRLKSGFADCDMENVFQAIGWNDIISQFARKGENGAHRSFFFFFSSELLNK